MLDKKRLEFLRSDIGLRYTFSPWIHPVLAQTQISHCQTAPNNPFIVQCNSESSWNACGFCHLGRKSKVKASLTRILALFFLIFTSFGYIHINSLSPGFQISESHWIKHSGKEHSFTDILNPSCNGHLLYTTHFRSKQTWFSVCQRKLPRNNLHSTSGDKWGFLLGARVHMWGRAKFVEESRVRRMHGIQ